MAARFLSGSQTRRQFFFAPQPKCDFRLAPDEVHVWRASLLRGSGELDLLLRSLAPDERDRAARFHFEKDRRAFIAARGTLRALLGAYLDTPASAIRFGYGLQGKPELSPESPAAGEFHFNLSHSGDLALLAFSRCGAVGVDVESQEREAPLDVAERYFSDREVRCLASLRAPDQPLAFYQCWTRKEAFIKALGLGLFAPLNQFAVAFGPQARAALLECSPAFGPAERWRIEDIAPYPGYVAALAIRREAIHVQRFAWESVGLDDLSSGGGLPSRGDLPSRLGESRVGRSGAVPE